MGWWVKWMKGEGREIDRGGEWGCGFEFCRRCNQAPPPWRLEGPVGPDGCSSSALELWFSGRSIAPSVPGHHAIPPGTSSDVLAHLHLHHAPAAPCLPTFCSSAALHAGCHHRGQDRPRSPNQGNMTCRNMMGIAAHHHTAPLPTGGDDFMPLSNPVLDPPLPDLRVQHGRL